MKAIPAKTIERLIYYNRVLKNLKNQNTEFCFSHQLAGLANNSAAQVRRDIMLIGYNGGSSGKGYNVDSLIAKISALLLSGKTHKAAVVGIGNLGRAILSFFSYRQPNIEIPIAFDSDETKTGRVISGCRCFHINDLYKEITEQEITLGIVTVPALNAQEIVNELVDAGIKGILNFTPAVLRTPDDVFVEDQDMIMSLEKLAYLTATTN